MAEQISVSRDTLRAELSELELRLVERISQFQALNATKEEVKALEKRIASLERFRYTWPSAAFISAVAAIGSFIYYLWSH